MEHCGIWNWQLALAGLGPPSLFLFQAMNDNSFISDKMMRDEPVDPLASLPITASDATRCQRNRHRRAQTSSAKT